MHGKVCRVVVFEPVAHAGYQVAVVLGGLPGVELAAVDVEVDVAAAGPHAVGPVVVAVHLGIEHELGEQEVAGGGVDAAIVLALPVAALAGEVRGAVLQLVHDVLVHRRALLQLHLGHGGMARAVERQTAVEVDGIEVEHCTQGPCLVAPVGGVVALAVHLGIGVDVLQGAVAHDDRLEQVLPRVAYAVGAGAPAVAKQVLPQSAVVPVGAPRGQYGLVGGKLVQVIHAACRALQALAVVVAAHVVVERRHSVEIELGLVFIGFVLLDLTAGVFLQKVVARGETRRRGNCQHEVDDVSFH